MAFTDRFIKAPIRRTNSIKEDLTGKKHVRNTYLKIHPFEVCNYGPSWDDDADGEDEMTVTAIVLKNGESFTVYISVEEFETLLNKHQNP